MLNGTSWTTNPTGGVIMIGDPPTMDLIDEAIASAEVPDVPPEIRALPKINIITGAMKIAESGDDTVHLINVTASSTTEDLYGDSITEECIRDMARQAMKQLSGKPMTFFFNHRYSVPEDVFGKVASSSLVSRANEEDGTPIWDLDLAVQLAWSRQRVRDTWTLIKEDGVTLGVSIGAYILEYSFKDEKQGFWGGLIIEKMLLVETSIVGIPANQRSWVQNGVIAIGKSLGLNERALQKYVNGRMDREGVLMRSKNASLTAATETTVTEQTTESAATEETKSADPAQVEATEAAPEQESPAEEATVEETSETPADETTESPDSALTEAAPEVARKLEAGEVPEFEIVLQALEQAATELSASRARVKTLEAENTDLTAKLTQATQERDFATEIVEQIAKTPLGRKTQFAAPINSLRAKFAGIYDDGYLKLIDESQE